jgi:AraC-like DNA-binding protein
MKVTYPVDAMYEYYKQGATLRKVAEAYGLSEPSVARLFRDGGFEIRRQAARHPIKEMHECYKQGATLTEVGQRFGVSARYVGDLFRGAGLQVRSREETGAVRRAARPSASEMYGCYQQGASLKEVGRRFEVSEKQIRLLFHQAGLRVRSRADANALKKAKAPIEEMYEYYKQGATLREVAKRYGRSTTYVGRLFKERGLAVRLPGGHNPPAPG